MLGGMDLVGQVINESAEFFVPGSVAAVTVVNWYRVRDNQPENGGGCVVEGWRTRCGCKGNSCPEGFELRFSAFAVKKRPRTPTQSSGAFQESSPASTPIGAAT